VKRRKLAAFLAGLALVVAQSAYGPLGSAAPPVLFPTLWEVPGPSAAAFPVAKPDQTGKLGVIPCEGPDQQTFVVTHGFGDAGKSQYDPGHPDMTSDAQAKNARVWNLARLLKQNFPQAQVYVVDWAQWSGGLTPRQAAPAIVPVGRGLSAELQAMQSEGCFSPQNATFIGESFGNYVNFVACASMGTPCGTALAFDPAAAAGGFAPPNLQQAFTNSRAFETDSLWDTNQPIAACNVKLDTPYDRYPFSGDTYSHAKHVYGLQFAAVEKAAGLDAWFQSSLWPSTMPCTPAPDGSCLFDAEVAALPNTRVDAVDYAKAKGYSLYTPFSRAKKAHCGSRPTDYKLGRIAVSVDPNNLSATPPGGGAAGWISATTALTYMIHFENLPQATSVAQNVRVVLTLDPNLDPATVAEGSSSYSATQFTFDPTTGTLTWLLPGIDLPPDTNPPNGEGWVSFTVRPKAGLPTGTPIVESAQVFFDYNPPVQTGTVVRTIEAAPPSVAVQALPATVPAGPVQLSWQGGDGGSMNGAPSGVRRVRRLRRNGGWATPARCRFATRARTRPTPSGR
jgi:hypothetical protein